MKKAATLSRREQEILGTIFRLGEASANEIQKALPDSPSNSAVRTHLRNLVRKGHVSQKEHGLKYVYYPTRDIEEVSQSILENLVDTFFNGETLLAANQLLNFRLEDISEADLDALEQLIKDHRGKQKDKPKG